MSVFNTGVSLNTTITEVYEQCVVLFLSVNIEMDQIGKYLLSFRIFS